MLATLTILALAMTTFLAGATPTAQGKIPDGYNFVEVRVDRSTWTGPTTSTDALEARASVSLDGGATWLFLCSFKTLGGAIYPGQRSLNYTPGPTEKPIPYSAVGCGLPPGTGRLFKVDANIYQNLSTSVTAIFNP